VEVASEKFRPKRQEKREEHGASRRPVTFPSDFTHEVERSGDDFQGMSKQLGFDFP